MRVFSSTYTLDYSWPEVSTANWQKYSPWNQHSSHVTAVDTLSRHVDPATGILRTERLLTCTQPMPPWLSALLGNPSPTSHVYETSYVNPHAQRVTLCSSNLTFGTFLSVRETVLYEPDVSSTTEPGQERTRFTQEARITARCGGWRKIREKIEEVSVERFGDNARKGREGFEAVLEMSRRVWGEERERALSEGAKA